MTLYLPGISIPAAVNALAEKDLTFAQNAILALRSPLEGRRDILALRLAQTIAADDFAQATAFALQFKDQQIYSAMVNSTVSAGLESYDIAALPALVEGVMKLEASPEVANSAETVDPWMMAIAKHATFLAARAMDYATLDRVLALRPDLRDELIGSSVIHRLDETDFDKAQEYALSIGNSFIRYQALAKLGGVLARDTPGKSVAWVESLPNPDDRSNAYQGMTRTLSFETPAALTTFVHSIPTEENRRLFAKEYAGFLDKAALPDGETWKAALTAP